MALSLENLTAIDYDILEFINKNGKISKNDIFAKFHDKEATELRLSKLAEYTMRPHAGSSRIEMPSYIYEIMEKSNEPNYFPPPWDNVDAFISTGEYSLTDYGKKTLEDYLFQERTNSRKSKVEWVRYGITTLISIIALILSILAFMSNLPQNEKQSTSNYHDCSKFENYGKDAGEES